jgi:hypothetical protein
MNEEQKRAREVLQDLLALDEGLTNWEIDFIESVNQWQSDLTPKQIETLDKIYEKRC